MPRSSRGGGAGDVKPCPARVRVSAGSPSPIRLGDLGGPARAMPSRDQRLPSFRRSRYASSGRCGRCVAVGAASGLGPCGSAPRRPASGRVDSCSVRPTYCMAMRSALELAAVEDETMFVCAAAADSARGGNARRTRGPGRRACAGSSARPGSDARPPRPDVSHPALPSAQDAERPSTTLRVHQHTRLLC